MWDYVDKELANYNREYDKNNRKTKDEFQNILDKDKDLDEYVNKSDLNRLQRTITTNYEYLSDYGKFEAKKYLKKRRMRYADWFWFYFFMIYSLQAYQLAKIEDIIFTNIVVGTYDKEVKELSKVLKPKTISILKLKDKLVGDYNSKGYIWSEYKDTVTLYNTNELYNMVALQKRANKPLNVDNKEFRKLFDKQKHRLISIKDGRTSGSLDNMLIYLANGTKIETYIFNDVKKCRFIAILDDRTTITCEELDGHIFNVNDWNRFYKYSPEDKKEVYYAVKGMVAGVTLPPLHYNCRSTITYLLDERIANDVRNKLTKNE